MMKLACASMGIQGCPFVAEGETEDEVMGKLTEHGMPTHPEEVKKMMEEMGEEGMKNAMKSKIEQM